jgi:hypothetical protein
MIRLAPASGATGEAAPPAAMVRMLSKPKDGCGSGNPDVVDTLGVELHPFRYPSFYVNGRRFI